MAGTLSATVTPFVAATPVAAAFTSAGLLGVQSAIPVYTVTAAFSSGGALAAPITARYACAASFLSTGQLMATAISSFTPFTETNTPRTAQPLPTDAAFKGVSVTLIGQGGAGGSGRKVASISASGGGGGGAGAFIPRQFVPLALLGPNYSTTVAAVAATGGIAQATVNTDGSPGVAGAATVFSSGPTTLTAGGGGAGPGGNATQVAGGTASTVTGTTFGDAGTAGGTSSAATGASTFGTNNGASNSGGAGGGGGGAIAGNGAAGNASGGGATNGQAGGVGPTAAAGAVGGSGSSLVAGLAGSGGGGSAGLATATFAAGNAPGYGGGGGGGKGGTGATSGKGGDGGPGYSLLEFTDSPPVTFDAVGAAVFGTGTMSWLHNITGNCVVVDVLYWGTSATPTVTAQVGSAPMIELGRRQNYISASGNFATLIQFGLLNGPTGPQTINFSAPGNSNSIANSRSYHSVASFGTVVTNAGATSTLTLTVPTTNTRQMVAQAFGAYVGALSAYNQTLRYGKNNNVAPAVNLDFMMGDAVGTPTSVTFTATEGIAYNWAAIGVPLIP